MRGIVRRFLPDRNPLRRTVDRVEAAVMAGLFVVFLAGASLAALAAAGHVTASGLRAERAEASWRRVPAVLLQNAPRAAQSPDEDSTIPLVRARWTAPDGTPRVGELYAPYGAAAGTTVPVWTDRSGNLEAAPVEHGYVVAQATFTALTAVALVAAAVAVTGLLARRALDRHRLAAWEAEWARTGPQWTGRR